MLSSANQIYSFDQFLFSQFQLNIEKCEEKIAKKVKAVAKKKRQVIEKSDDYVSFEVFEKQRAEEVAVEKPIENVPVSADAEISKLAQIIDSIPDKVRSMNIEELAHKHESEWYHAFRDLKEEISVEISKRHPSQSGLMAIRKEAKDFSEILDEHIEKVILELERIFQVFPTMSRVALLYLVSLVVAIPLMFFSMASGKTISYNLPEKTINYSAEKLTELTDEMKSSYIARNSVRILATKQDTFAVTDINMPGRVAGAYEDALVEDKVSDAGKNISWLYRYLRNIKEELGNLLIP